MRKNNINRYKKIPNLIASAAEDEYLDWYYLNIEKGKYNLWDILVDKIVFALSLYAQRIADAERNNAQRQQQQSTNEQYDNYHP